MKSIPYGKQSISQQDIDMVTEVLKSDYLTQGPYVKLFEDKFANLVGAKYAVAVCNGTAALHLSTLALGLKKGDKVVTTPITFAASANCVKYCGADVLFSDIDKESLLLDLDKFEKLLEEHNSGQVKGVIPVNFAGKAIDMERLRSICDKYGLWILEDSCHAPGAFFVDSKGQKQLCGNGIYSDLTVFSFHPVKHIATGEGGMITTNNKELYDKLIQLRTHGITKEPSKLEKNDGDWYYEMQELGYNYRISDILCALGYSQLDRFQSGLVKRRAIVSKYNSEFSKIDDIKTYPFDEGHAYHLYIIWVQDRKKLFDFLRSKNIFAQIHYYPLHLMPFYKQFGYKEGDFIESENYYNGCISLPIFPGLEEEEQKYVIDQIKLFYRSKNKL